MGIVELEERQFGLEAAGVVSRIGPDVQDIQVGDRVLCLKKKAFASSFTTPRFTCIKMPDDLDFEEGATMLVPYATAIYSLLNVGGLVKGQVCSTTPVVYIY